jgi:hypothetical protein
MATTTPNYGWAVPTSTDLVKDGATAIETLGDAIDASMNTALGTKKAGMVLLNTTSFSGVTNQSFNNVFSATYNSYLVLISDITGSGTSTFDLRLRASGTDATGADYYWGLAITNTAASSIPAGGSAATSFRLCNTVAAARGFVTLQISNPFLTKVTMFNSTFVGEFSGNIAGGAGGGMHIPATSYDGFSLLASNNHSGTVTIYGYNK